MNVLRWRPITICQCVVLIIQPPDADMIWVKTEYTCPTHAALKSQKLVDALLAASRRLSLG